MDKKRKAGLIIVVVCVLSLIIHFSLSQKNKYLIYEGSSQKVNEKKRNENDTLYIGISQISDSIHPYKYDNETMDILRNLVYEPLINMKEDTSIEFINAKDIVFKNEGKEAYIKINTNKVFSDKTTMTVDLIIESYRWFMKQETAYSEILRNVEEIKKIDDQNILFTFKEPNLENIKVFMMPLIYQNDKESYYGTTCLGTGAYKITQLKSQQEIMLEKNNESKRREKYETIVLKLIDYTNIDSVIKNQDIDIFMINQENHFDKIKDSGAYDVYELENKQMGYYLVYNIKEDSIKNAIAKTVEGKTFFEKTQDYGIYSSGIVSAHKAGSSYYSLIKSGNFQNIESLKICHDVNGVSLGIYQNLSKKLKEVGIECQDVGVAVNGYGPFKEDILIYKGNYNKILTEEIVKEFYKSYSEISVEEFYNELEQYLSNKNLMSPLSKETKWIASLTTKDTLNFFE